MSSQTSRTISAKNIDPSVALRTATICSPNSYRRSPSGDFPKRFSGSKRNASNDRKSNPHVSSKTSSINPQPSSVSASKGSSARRTEHSKENCTLPSSGGWPSFDFCRRIIAEAAPLAAIFGGWDTMLPGAWGSCLNDAENPIVGDVGAGLGQHPGMPMHGPHSASWRA
jgi:hypothetical protein